MIPSHISQLSSIQSTGSSSTNQAVFLQNSFTKEDVYKKLSEHFPFLEDQRKCKAFCASYDFGEYEQERIKKWYFVLSYMYKEIFNTFAIKYEDIVHFTKFQKYCPYNLNAIINELQSLGYYILQSDLKDFNFYRNISPEIEENKSSWFGKMFSGIGSWFSFGQKMVNCKTKEEEDIEMMNAQERLNKQYENSQLPAKEWMTKEQKYEPIKSNTLIIDYLLFKMHCDSMIEFIDNYLSRDFSSVCTRDGVLNEIKAAEENALSNNPNVPSPIFGSQFFDLVLLFLEGRGQIVQFNVINSRKQKVKCIKIIKSQEEYQITKKDETLILLQLTLEDFKQRLTENDNNWSKLTKEAQNCIRKGNRKDAANYLKRRKLVEKAKQNNHNTILTLENQIMNLKSNENNVATMSALKNAMEAHKEFGVDPDQMKEITDDLLEQKDAMNELGNYMKEYGNDGINEEELDNELKEIEMEETEKELLNNNNDNSNINDGFPRAGVENPFEKINSSYNKEDENMNIMNE